MSSAQQLTAPLRALMPHTSMNERTLKLCVYAVHVNVNVITQVFGMCVLRCRILAQANTHHTHSPPKFTAHARWRSVSYKTEKLFDYKIALAVYSSAGRASSCTGVPAGRGQ